MYTESPTLATYMSACIIRGQVQ